MYIVSGVATLPYRREAADAVILAYEKPNAIALCFALTHPKIGPGNPSLQVRLDVTFKFGNSLSRAINCRFALLR